MKIKIIYFVILLSIIFSKHSTSQVINQELVEAIILKDIKSVQECLDNGADVNAKYQNGYTALMVAVMNGHTEIVKLLIEKGADINISSNDNKSALNFADDEEIIHILEKLGAKRLQQEKKHYTKKEPEGGWLGKFSGNMMPMYEEMKCYILAIYGKKIDISGEFVFGYEGTLFGKTFDITNNTIILDENDNNISVSEFIYQKYEPILLWATGEKVKKIKLFRIIQLKDQELDQLINALNLSKKDIKKIQVLLEKLGYKPGIPDGILGLNTKRSIKSFLENHYDGITALNELILNLEFASKPRNLTLNDEAEEKDINMVLYELRNPKDGYAKAVGGCRADIPKEYLKKINKSIESLLKSIPPGKLKIMVMTEDSEIFTTSLIDIVD